MQQKFFYLKGTIMDKLYIIIPAYNEEENIGKIVKEWHKVMEKVIAEGASSKSKLIVIDDGSKDSTYAIMEELARKELAYFLPITKPNSGHGATVLYGYKYAIKKGADYIFQTDSDGQTVSQEFYEFWNLRKDYDMVIGARKHREDGYSRILVTKVLKLVIRLCFHTNVEDANTPFRLMKADTLKKYIRMMPKDFNLSNVLISVIFTKANAQIKYIPITFRPRQGGVNSINIKSITKIGIQAVRDFRRINKRLKSL